MLIRAGASNREMAGALGVNINLLYTLVFGLGAALAGLAGLMQAPILTVQIGMGENILILAFVVIIIGGIGSIRGAFVAAVLVGLIDTLGRAFLPELLRLVMSVRGAATVAPAMSSMMIYLLMAAVLVWRPEGLFPVSKQMIPTAGNVGLGQRFREDNGAISMRTLLTPRNIVVSLLLISWLWCRPTRRSPAIIFS